MVCRVFKEARPAVMPEISTSNTILAPLCRVLDVFGANSQWYGVWLLAAQSVAPQRYGAESSFPRVPIEVGKSEFCISPPGNT